MADLTLKERQNIQNALEATREGAIRQYRSYVDTYDTPTAGVTFAKEILECEILMKFNAAAIKEAQAKAKASSKPQVNKAPDSP